MTDENTALAFNPTDGPVVVDGEGRTIAGGSWGAIRVAEEASAAALAAGRLVVVDAAAVADAGDDAAPEAREALKALGELRGPPKATTRRSAGEKE